MVSTGMDKKSAPPAPTPTRRRLITDSETARPGLDSPAGRAGVSMTDMCASPSDMLIVRGMALPKRQQSTFFFTCLSRSCADAETRSSSTTTSRFATLNPRHYLLSDEDVTSPASTRLTTSSAFVNESARAIRSDGNAANAPLRLVVLVGQTVVASARPPARLHHALTPSASPPRSCLATSRT